MHNTGKGLTVITTNLDRDVLDRIQQYMRHPYCPIPSCSEMMRLAIRQYIDYNGWVDEPIDNQRRTKNLRKVTSINVPELELQFIRTETKMSVSQFCRLAIVAFLKDEKVRFDHLQNGYKQYQRGLLHHTVQRSEQIEESSEPATVVEEKYGFICFSDGSKVKKKELMRYV